jgi:hypothetical protein
MRTRKKWRLLYTGICRTEEAASGRKILGLVDAHEKKMAPYFTPVFAELKKPPLFGKSWA